MRRSVPLVLVASASSALADSVATQLRREGKVVYVAHSADGALRVACGVGPDIVLLDPTFPSRIEDLLRAHPMTAEAEILHLAARMPRLGIVDADVPASAGPHAA